jgi:hypothetical protein
VTVWAVAAFASRETTRHSLYHVISAHFRTGSLAKGIALVDEIGQLAGGADQAEARIAAALAAGGHLVSDAHAPMWWVLADAEGNEACVATWVGRE